MSRLVVWFAWLVLSIVSWLVVPSAAAGSVALVPGVDSQCAYDAVLQVLGACDDSDESKSVVYDNKANYSRIAFEQGRAIFVDSDLDEGFVAPRGLAGIADAGSISPVNVRFSQSSIRRGFSDGNGTIDDLVSGLRSGSVDPGDVPPIRILERDGQIFTLDNRRSYAFQEAGVNIRYTLATATEIVDEGWKFTTTNGGTSIRIRGG